MKLNFFYFSFVFLILSSEYLNAQPNYTWAKAFSGPGASWGTTIKVDALGNIYTAGTFYGVCDFDPGPGTYTLASVNSVESIFVSKLDPAGNFIWARGGARGAEVNSCAIDEVGNVYLTGNFGVAADFDFGIGTFTLASVGWSDVFICKMDSSGNFIWAKQIGSSRTDAALSIAIDTLGYIVTTGYINYTADFDPGPGTYTLTPNSIDISAIYISKLDTAGNFVWAKKIESNSEINSMTLDHSGNIYIGGCHRNTEDFDPGNSTYYLSSVGDFDISIIKLDPLGNFIWAKQMGGLKSDACFSIAVDGKSNVYTTGHFMETVDFDPGSGTYNLTSTGDWDMFISKLDAAGKFLWAKRIGGKYVNRGTSIVVDLYSNVYTIGSLYDSTDFDPGIGVNMLVSKGNEDFFISQLDCSGNFLWAGQIGGTAEDAAFSITVDACGSIYTTGYFQFLTDFDPGHEIQNLPFNDEVDAFICKLGQIPLAPTVTPSSNTICIGRSTTLNATSGWLGAASWNWYADNCGTNFTGTGSSIVVSPTTATTYYVRAENSCYTTECTSVTINTIISPEAKFETSYSVTCQGLTEKYFNKSENSDSYQWNFNNGSSTDTNVNHDFNYNETSVTSLIAINNNGCRDTLNFENVIGSFKDYFSFTPPNVFTPNNDGVNDEFKISITEDIARCSKITIFDRWGKLLFTSMDNNLSWDGHTTSGSKAVAGTYFYILKINDQKYNGTFTLLD